MLSYPNKYHRKMLLDILAFRILKGLDAIQDDPNACKIGMILLGMHIILKVQLKSYMSLSSTETLMNFFDS